MDYPQLAIDQDIQGEVIVEVIVDGKGNPINFSIFKGVHELLDKPVLKESQRILKWKPAIYENMPVKSKVYLSYKFILG